MERVVARFEKVSYEEFKKSWIEVNPLDNEEIIKEIYDNIKLPTRSTKRSSGYDFYCPDTRPVYVRVGQSKLIPTGIRCVFLKDRYDLTIYPRSGMGFKYRAHLDSTVGIIDNDYYEAYNEGHIKIKISCDPRDSDCMIINPGDRYAQGIIREFFLAEGDDEVEKEDRRGGIGHTGK